MKIIACVVACGVLALGISTYADGPGRVVARRIAAGVTDVTPTTVPTIGAFAIVPWAELFILQNKVALEASRLENMKGEILDGGSNIVHKNGRGTTITGKDGEVIYMVFGSDLNALKAKLAAETARADMAEARAKAAEAMLTDEQKAKLGK
jgi:hypothetical protein